METKTRKPTRLKNYDYSSAGVYFITFCTADKKKILWQTVAATSGRHNDYDLTEIGTSVKKHIELVSENYECVYVDKYAIMPNHVHLLLRISVDEGRRPMVVPTVSRVINQLKGSVTRETGKSIWQRGFYDHIVRDDYDYNSIFEYIDLNPVRWREDRFY